LEIGLWVDIELFVQNLSESGIDVLFYKFLCFCVPEVEIESPEKSFKGIGNDIRIGIASGKELSFGDENVVL
jgi:hypothetical protein